MVAWLGLYWPFPLASSTKRKPAAASATAPPGHLTSTSLSADEEMNRLLQGCPFYFADMSRSDAESLLKCDQHMKEKEFLFRASSQAGHVALSVCTEHGAKHFLVCYQKSSWALLIDHRPQFPFPFIDQLVEFHRAGRPGVPPLLGDAITHARAAMIRAARKTAEAQRQAAATASAPAEALRRGRAPCSQCQGPLAPDAIVCAQCGADCPVDRDEQVDLSSSGHASSCESLNLEGRPDNDKVILATAEDILRHINVCLMCFSFWVLAIWFCDGMRGN